MRYLKLFLIFTALLLTSCSNESSKKMGVAVIVGLVLSSTLYIWNSESFNTTQKIILSILALFFPLQWAGIVICLIYNNYKKAQTKEYKTETKINATIDNLNSLKEKGILNEEEYQNKVNKLNIEKAEQDLKNSTEYKQLESLLNSGILTQDEFESKIKLISSEINAKLEEKNKYQVYKTNQGVFKVERCIELTGQKIYKDDEVAPDGKYHLGYMTFIHVKNGIIIKETLL